MPTIAASKLLKGLSLVKNLLRGQVNWLDEHPLDLFLVSLTQCSLRHLGVFELGLFYL